MLWIKIHRYSIFQAAGSLGKYISTTEIPDAQLNNLFDDVTGDENAAWNIEYRCIFIHNTHTSLTLTDVFAWLSAEIAGGANISISEEGMIASKVVDSTVIQAESSADKNTEPQGVLWFEPTTKETGVALGNISADWVRALWIERRAQNSVALNNDGVTLTIEGDTQA